LTKGFLLSGAPKAAGNDFVTLTLIPVIYSDIPRKSHAKFSLFIILSWFLFYFILSRNERHREYPCRAGHAMRPNPERGNFLTEVADLSRSGSGPAALAAVSQAGMQKAARGKPSRP
jgi:hypothetical protein